VTYTATSSRVPYVMALEGFFPRRLSRLSSREVPLLSLCLCYLASVLIILVFPNWEDLLQFVTAAVVLMYALAPVALGVIRATGPELRRPYRLRHPGLTAPVAFIVADFLLLWTGWNTLSKLFSVVGVGVVALVGLAILRPHYRHSIHEWWAASWLVPYVAGMALISSLSPFGGGEKSPDRQWLYMAICAAFSLAVYYLAVYLGTQACRRMAKGDRPLDRWHRAEQRLREAAAGAASGDESAVTSDPAPDGA
jgi:amino acid transporter